jgi:hypothetical protein
VEEPEQLVSSAETERMMKVREVILKATGRCDGGGSDEKQRYEGPYNHRKRRPSPKRVPLEAAEKVLGRVLRF